MALDVLHERFWLTVRALPFAATLLLIIEAWFLLLFVAGMSAYACVFISRAGRKIRLQQPLTDHERSFLETPFGILGALGLAGTRRLTRDSTRLLS